MVHQAAFNSFNWWLLDLARLARQSGTASASSGNMYARISSRTLMYYASCWLPQNPTILVQHSDECPQKTDPLEVSAYRSRCKGRTHKLACETHEQCGVCSEGMV